MWLPNDVVKSVDAVARIYYINKIESQRWNEHRRRGELRMLTGWCWSAKASGEQRYGFKTMTVAYRDAWYSLVNKSELPRVRYRANLERVA